MSAAALFLAACGPQAVAPPAVLPPNPEQQFSALERRYVIFVLERYPVVSTYLGGSEFDRTLADNDGKLRDYSADSLKDEDAHLGEFRERFTALDPNTLAPRRRIDRNVALAEIEFLLHQHQVLRHQERALDSYVDEPFRGVDWQIQGMTSTGSATLRHRIGVAGGHCTDPGDTGVPGGRGKAIGRRCRCEEHA